MDLSAEFPFSSKIASGCSIDFDPDRAFRQSRIFFDLFQLFAKIGDLFFASHFRQCDNEITWKFIASRGQQRFAKEFECSSRTVPRFGCEGFYPETGELGAGGGFVRFSKLFGRGDRIGVLFCVGTKPVAVLEIDAEILVPALFAASQAFFGTRSTQTTPRNCPFLLSPHFARSAFPGKKRTSPCSAAIWSH